jgi:uncharacterized membrane protein YhaH (DUF805 family)
MFDQMKYPRESGTSSSSSDRRRSVAWILVLIVDVGFVLWGAGAAWAPDGLVGPGGKAILPAAFEGFSGGSWSALVSTSPLTASYMILLYRTYGFYNVAFGLTTVAITVTAFRRGERWAWWALLLGNTITLVSAIAYDRISNAIGPFELTEYLGLAMVLGALAITAPLPAANRARAQAA